MFIGKFNFDKVCSNAISPAFRDVPATTDSKPAKKPPRRPIQSLAQENSKLDKQTSAFAEKNAGRKWGAAAAAKDKESEASRGRSRATLDTPKGMKRGLSADPNLRGARAAKKTPEEPAPPTPDISITPAEPSEQTEKTSSAEIEEPVKRKSSKERFRAVVQTKVGSLNAFKKGVKKVEGECGPCCVH